MTDPDPALEETPSGSHPSGPEAPGDAPSVQRPFVRTMLGPGTLVLGAGAALLIGFLAAGLLLPGTWEAQVEARVPVSAIELLAYLDSPEGWREWTTWPDSALTRSGPDRGAGAALSWDDEELGTGTFRIDAVDAEGGVIYSVEVEGAGGGMMRTEGRLVLAPAGDSTDVRWQESGDLGGNPLMGYWALFMERAQGAEMRKSLERLAEVAAGGR